MNLIYEFDVDILQMYPQNKNKLSRSRLSEVRTLQRDTRTDATHAALPGGKIIYSVAHFLCNM